MALLHLTVSGLRNLTSVSIQPLTSGFNFFYGANGSGKTSLLEAIYYLSLGRSFRSSINDRVLHWTRDKMTLFAHLSRPQSPIPYHVGLERCLKKGLELKIDGQSHYSIADFAQLLPTQLLDTHCHTLLEGGPAYRRKYLDWGTFYYTIDFFPAWRAFQRALKQRNAALRAQAPLNELAPWTEKVLSMGLTLDAARQAYFNALAPKILDYLQALLPISNLELQYYSGWEGPFSKVLAKNLSKDYHYGYTVAGPQKADLKILINGIPARDILSRGQQKMFVCAMMLARGSLLQGPVKKPIYLVDDLPAELDEVNRCRLLTSLSEQQAQIFVTATDKNSWNAFIVPATTKLFHVEHGVIEEVTGFVSGE